MSNDSRPIFQFHSGGSTMFNQLFNRPRDLKRHMTAPLAEERLRYLSHCAEQGTRKSSLRRIAQAQLMIIEQLGLTADVKLTSKQIEAAADRWAALKPPKRNQALKEVG